jgi:hypothetical protein
MRAGHLLFRINAETLVVRQEKDKDDLDYNVHMQNLCNEIFNPQKYTY